MEIKTNAIKMLLDDFYMRTFHPADEMFIHPGMYSKLRDEFLLCLNLEVKESEVKKVTLSTLFGVKIITNKFLRESEIVLRGNGKTNEYTFTHDDLDNIFWHVTDSDGKKDLILHLTAEEAKSWVTDAQIDIAKRYRMIRINEKDAKQFACLSGMILKSDVKKLRMIR